jgi:tetraacyldisaccharide 4'-kinase
MNEVWYGDRPPPLWLRGLVPVYRTGQRIDRWWKSRERPDDLGGACIVIVGNITVGGSGKTPLVVRLCRLLRQAGLAPGVVSRGYGGKEGSLRLVSPASDPAEVGDEPVLIARQAKVPVFVSADRCAAARALLKRQVNVIVSDDGLQHYRLPRNVEICVIDGTRGLGNGRLLPAGPLREPPERLRSVDYVVINGEGAPLPPGIEASHMTLTGGQVRSLDDGQTWRLAQFGGCQVNAVAGIGNPARFFDLLRHARIKVIEHPFPDHYRFRRSDFDSMDDELPILMTEKDAVKCRSLGLKNAWYLPVEAHLPPDWEHAFLQRVVRELKQQSGPGPAVAEKVEP